MMKATEIIQGLTIVGENSNNITNKKQATVSSAFVSLDFTIRYTERDDKNVIQINSYTQHSHMCRLANKNIQD